MALAGWRPRASSADDGSAAYGVGLLVRGSVVAARRVRLPGGGAGGGRPAATPQRRGWDREPRVALVASVATGDTPVTVIVTHLSYLPVRAVRQLRTAAGIAAGTAARLVVGDFNLPAWLVRAVVPGARAPACCGGGFARGAGGEASLPSPPAPRGGECKKDNPEKTRPRHKCR